jgi:hypothetical protein
MPIIKHDPNMWTEAEVRMLKKKTSIINDRLIAERGGVGEDTVYNFIHLVTEEILDPFGM